MSTVRFIGVSRGRGFDLAPLTVQQSTTILRQTLEGIRTQDAPEHRGAFLHHDGKPLPW
jgi:hypothetical protein